ncbi:glutathione S-transferase theta-1-like [Ptychodera flava]|uniref:glutathione S-transferase theta-1-like n=1 Tax=Ptychodera flava TaxID=63121 RepID=UPI003969CB7A
MVVLHFNPLSQPSRAVLMFLEVNGIPYVRKVIDLGRGEHRTAEFKKINPVQKVPVISDEDFHLSESVAILIYLATKHRVADHWYPSNTEKRARVNEYLAWHHNNLRPPCGMLFFNEILLPARTKKPVNTEEVEKCLSQLGEMFNKFESMFLKDSSFVCGEEISIADLLAVCEVMQAQATGHDVFKGHPKVKAWTDRVRLHMNPQFDDAHAVLYKVQNKRMKRKDTSSKL